jgi:formylglycine-generating enzyme required for sulfatase activity
VNNPGYDAAFYTKPQASQPGAKNDAAGSNKVARGGCGTSAGMELRAAARFGSDKAGPWTGVRCAKDFQ